MVDCKGNTGDSNSGYWNTGYRNSGDHNTGDHNTGNRNTGHSNTGYSNSGHRNTGHSNTGNRNSGDHNTGDHNTGFFNTVTPQKILVFNRECDREVFDNADLPDWIRVSLTKWVPEDDMTDKEKDAYPSYATTGGYLKAYASLKSAYLDAWNNASYEDKKKTFNIPNYDPGVAEEIFGFRPTLGRIITIDGKEVEISEEGYKKLKEELIHD